MSVSAYILIQTEVGKAAAVAQQIGALAGVTSAEDVTGPYDVIVRAEAETRRRARQAGRRQRAGGRRHHPHADLPRRPPLDGSPPADAEPRIDPDRAAALIATGVTLPLVVLVGARLIGAAHRRQRPRLQPDRRRAAGRDACRCAPPNATRRRAAAPKCSQPLPVTLGDAGRRASCTPSPTRPYVVAWGNPAVVLRCGVRAAGRRCTRAERRSSMTAGEVDRAVLRRHRGTATATSSPTVDRAAYIAVTVPVEVPGRRRMPPLSAAIAKALPAVCSATRPRAADPDRSSAPAGPSDRCRRAPDVTGNCGGTRSSAFEAAGAARRRPARRR